VPRGGTDPRASRGGSTWVKLGVLALVLVGAYVVARVTGVTRYTDLHTLSVAVRRARGAPGAAPLFVAIYAVVAALGLPGLPATLAGGAIFGFALGTLLNWLGATLGATAAYLLARALGRDAIARLLGARATSLDRLTSAHGFATLLRLRLIPIVPFNVLNFGAGLAGISLRSYVLATALGILPGTAVYTYFADALLAGATTAKREALLRVAIAGGLLIALSFLPALARRLRPGSPSS
jgi:uncharacterized membrane protein YdjX (TVP38/TMEM64 family)